MATTSDLEQNTLHLTSTVSPNIDHSTPLSTPLSTRPLWPTDRTEPARARRAAPESGEDPFSTPTAFTTPDLADLATKLRRSNDSRRHFAPWPVYF